jgi:hypothetical protein
MLGRGQNVLIPNGSKLGISHGKFFHLYACFYQADLDSSNDFYDDVR